MEEYINEFINQFSKKIIEEKASIFVGSGLSYGCGFCQWSEFVNNFTKDIQIDISKEIDYPLMAQYYENENNRTKINEALKNCFGKKGTLTPSHRIIASLPIKSIWTTNYDQMLENAFDEKNRKYSVLTNDKSYIGLSSDSEVLIYKIHGDCDRPSECVVTRNDYEQYVSTHKIIKSQLIGELCTKSFLFIGFSFSDSDVSDIYSLIRDIYNKDNPQSHYFFIEKIKKYPEESENDFRYREHKRKLFIADMKKYNYFALELNSYDEIVEILECVKQKVHKRNIYISGSYEDDNEKSEHIKKVAKVLSEKLIKNGYSIYTSFGKNLGLDISEGALFGCAELIKSDSDTYNKQVHFFPFPFKMKKGKSRTVLLNSMRQSLISKTSVTIVIAGEKKENDKSIISKGTLEEYQLTINCKNLVIPIASTGSAAYKIWEETNGNESIDKNLYMSLKNEKNVEVLCENIIKILNDRK